MRINKDEARILAAGVEEIKWGSSAIHENLFDRLEELQKKLEAFGKDERRTGRTSQDDYSDCLKRYAEKAATNNRGIEG